MEKLEKRFRHAPSFTSARSAAEEIRAKLKIEEEPRVGLVLGTGWGDTLRLADEREINFKDVPGFSALGDLEGHRRVIVAGRLRGTPVVALRGRVHLNEKPCDPDVYAMTRLQAEMLIHLGVRTLILTCAAGSLKEDIRAGSVVFADGFITAYAPPMPLFAGEFVSPDDVIDRRVMEAERRFSMLPGHHGVAKIGGHLMVPGPFFEGRKYDKPFYAASGASVIGMSVLPEACVAALYRDEGACIIPIAFVSNTATEEHSHEENMRRAKATAETLGDALRMAVSADDWFRSK